MPNHTDTNLTVTGTEDKVQEFIDTCMIEKEKEDYNGKIAINEDTGEPIKFTELDFNTIIPMPDSMHITSGTTTDDAIALIKAENGDMSGVETISNYAWVREKCPEGVEIEFTIKHLKDRVTDEHRKEGEIALDNIKKYGCQDWYSWANKHWGTKWGAYDCKEVDRSEGKFVLSYSTAWSPATPIINKLGEMFPELTFVNSYMDEGWGYYGYHTVCVQDNINEEDGGVCDGEEFLNFANNRLGYDLRFCEGCGGVHNPDWSEGDGTLCYDCQEKDDNESAPNVTGV